MRLAHSLVEQGAFRGRDFAEMLYGAPIRGLARNAAMALVLMIAADDDPRAIEAALGMFDQWINDHKSELDELVDVASRLAERAAAVPEPAQSSMLTHYLGRLLREIPLSFDAKAQVWKTRVYESGVSAPHEEHPLIDDLIADNPQRAADLVFDILSQAVSPPYQEWAYSLEDYKLLSRLGAAISGEVIWNRLAQHTDTELRFLLRHTGWGGGEPGPVVREFLLSDRLEPLQDEARVNFFNSLGTVTGPYYLALERELERARRWLELLNGTSAEAWARNLVEDYQLQIPAEKIREQEEDIRFR